MDTGLDIRRKGCRTGGLRRVQDGIVAGGGGGSGAGPAYFWLESTNYDLDLVPN